MCINKNELASYESLNTIARKNSVVIIGSTYMKEMPVGELKQIFGIMSDIYNRSLSSLSIFEAKEVILNTMKDLYPKKVVLQLGETDLEDGTNTAEKVIAEYEEIIKAIKKADKKIKIVTVSINCLKDKALEKEYNRQLEQISKNNKCQFADISSAGENDVSRIKTFRLLRYFMADDYLFSIM